jgi:hypothetical protein
VFGNERPAYAEAFRVFGDLYGADWEELEARNIREWCELFAEVPMGYGRVGRVPSQLSDDESIPIGPHRIEGNLPT